ncbi:MAG: hypothetical protein Tsb009_29550 [Planctomycetaceae bacterium]
MLYLPIMLFVMALMVNFGNMAAWKIRAQSNTRYSATRTLDDRTGNREANPKTWPRPASLRESSGDNASDVDAIWNQHPDLITPVTRGPMIAESNQGGRILVPGRFTMHDTVHRGQGSVSRSLPMLRGILPNNGRYGYTEEHDLLDNRWDYRHLVHPTNPYDRRDVPGDSGNRRRRAKRWYRIDPEFFGELGSEMQRLLQADQRLKTNPSRYDLDPLDRDRDFYAIRLAQQLGTIASQPPREIPEGTRINIPDFHPRARIRTELSPLRVQVGIVNPLLNEIQHLPGRMANAFIGLYSGEIARLEAMMPRPAGEIARLERLLEQVRAFRDSLPGNYR